MKKYKILLAIPVVLVVGLVPMFLFFGQEPETIIVDCEYFSEGISDSLDDYHDLILHKNFTDVSVEQQLKAVNKANEMLDLYKKIVKYVKNKSQHFYYTISLHNRARVKQISISFTVHPVFRCPMVRAQNHHSYYKVSSFKITL